VSGPSFPGKTSFCIQLLQNLDALSTEREFGEGIISYYSEKIAVPEHQRLPCKNIKHNQDVPENFGAGVGKQSLVILDDLLNNIYSKQVCDLFTRGSHHRNISMISIKQNLFH